MQEIWTIPMLNDEKLAELSYEIDDTLMKLATKYKCSSLSLSSIMIARLMRLVMETGDLSDLKSILAVAINTDERRTDNRVLQ